MEKNYQIKVPYPGITDIIPDTNLAKMLMQDYAGKNGEITGIMKYTYQRFYTDSIGYQDISQALKSISTTEMIHMDMLGELITKLGGDPKYLSHYQGRIMWWDGDFVDYTRDIIKMLNNNIASEISAINAYNKLKEYTKDEMVYAIIDRIIMDEKMHIEIFRDLLEKYKEKHTPN